MKTLATFVLCLSLLAGFTACDKNDDNMGTLIVEIRDNAKASVLNIYTEEGSLIYTNTEYLYQNDPRLSIPLHSLSACRCSPVLSPATRTTTWEH